LIDVCRYNIPLLQVMRCDWRGDQVGICAVCSVETSESNWTFVPNLGCSVPPKQLRSESFLRPHLILSTNVTSFVR